MLFAKLCNYDHKRVQDAIIIEHYIISHYNSSYFSVEQDTLNSVFMNEYVWQFLSNILMWDFVNIKSIQPLSNAVLMYHWNPIEYDTK